MIRPVAAVWPRLSLRIKTAKKKLLLLDFDGTLAPIAKTPDAVVFSRRMGKALDKLRRRKDVVLCVISGRSIVDLKKHFGGRRLLFVGNHGFEFENGGMTPPKRARAAKKLSALLWLLAENLTEYLKGLPGILVENKVYTLSVHYRNLPARFLPVFRKKIIALRKKYAHFPLAWKAGKKVWSVQPAAPWNKGAAALYVCRRFPDALPVALGDDVTDEDMFKALGRRAITIRVGLYRKSFAEYYLRSTAAVAGFLEEVSRL